MKYLVEYLPRINCVAVHVTEAETVTLEEMSSQRLIIGYQSEELSDKIHMTITLPKAIDVNENMSVNFTKGANNSWSLRMKVDPALQPPVSRSLELDDMQNTTFNKWHRRFLKELGTFTFRCENCEAPILDSISNCKLLNDMPSDNWMELMDFWHCSKPDMHKAEEGTFASMTASRYAALKPLANEVLVGGSYFSTIYETISESVIEQNNKSLSCHSCDNILGERTTDGLCKLYKWKLQLYNGKTEQTDTYDPKNDIILSILNYTKNYSGRYILLKCKGYDDILLWIFALDIGVTLGNNVVYSEAIKVLYLTDEAHFSDVKKTHNVENITVKELPLEKFLAEMNQNHHLLPKSAKTFNSWQVSYLPLV